MEVCVAVMGLNSLSKPKKKKFFYNYLSSSKPIRILPVHDPGEPIWLPTHSLSDLQYL